MLLNISRGHAISQHSVTTILPDIEEVAGCRQAARLSAVNVVGRASARLPF